VQNETKKRAEENEPGGGAPEPDKLTTAQPAGESEADEAERGAGSEEEEEAVEALADAIQAAGAEGDAEPAAAAGDDGDQAEATEDAADVAEDTEDAEAGAEQPGEEVVTERADEAPEQATAEASAAIAANLDAARAEAESYLDDLRRLQADFDNYRKRTLREQTARAASASQALVARLLPVLDNFELAVSASEQSRDFDRMLKGVEMVFGELREVLQSEGLVRIEAEGKPFDPERHEAVVAVEQEDVEPGMVVDVVRAGYELRGKVLRPAMVKVAK
jgi:molecular chaperone GrpE